MGADPLFGLNALFMWVRDSIDGYSILRGAAEFPQPFVVAGDCDDYAVTALWLLEGRSMAAWWGALIKGRARLVHTLDGAGQRHMVLYHRDHGYIECQRRKWSAACPFTVRGHAMLPTILLKIAVGKLTK